MPWFVRPRFGAVAIASDNVPRVHLHKRAFRVTLRCAAFAAATMTLSAATLAQPPTDAKRRAEAPMREGMDLARAGKAEAALTKFEESYSLSPTGAALVQMGRMEQTLGRHALALQHYREALRDPNLAIDPRREAEKAVEELKAKVGVLTLDVPDGCTTTVDGSPVDTKTVEVVPGLHVVRIKLGSDVKSADVTAPAGAVVAVKIRFGEDPPAPAPAGDPSTVTPPPNEERSSTWGTARVVAVGALAAGAVTGVVLSIVFHGNASDDVDESKRLLNGGSCLGITTADCTRARELKDSRDTNVTASTVSLVAGGVLAAGAVAAAIVWPGGATASKTSGRVVPSFAAGYGGMTLMGRF